MNQKAVIDILSNCYSKEKKVLLDSQSGYKDYSRNRIVNSQKICDTLEKKVMCLKDDDYFIIYNEVIKGRKGKWYEDYFSESSYYRHRKSAYSKYIKSLDI